MNVRELRAKRESLIVEARKLVELAEGENRDLNPEEQTKYDALTAEARSLDQRIQRQESLLATLPVGGANRQAPAFNRTRLGDSEERALAHFFRTGDQGAVRDLVVEDEDDDGDRQIRGRGESISIALPSPREQRAVTDSTMNITTAGDGGNAVPTGFSGQIARRLCEVRLVDRLGCLRVPGVGTTVNFPYQSADAQVFATTSEQADNHANNYERDAMQLGTKAFTLVKKTKKVELTEELLEDEDANVNDYVAQVVGDGMGVTHNSLLLVEAAANGTSLKTFAAAAAIAAGEPEDLVYHDTLGYYLDDASNPAWITRPTTFGAIKSLTGNTRQYAEQTLGSNGRRTLLEYPAFFSNQAAAMGASAKSLYFGNWRYMGYREGQVLNLIRDPYTTDGLVILKYSFRAVYGVLIAGALGYGVHPSA